MKAAILGLGSAGARHLNHLYDLDVREFVVYRARHRPSPRPLRTENFLTVTSLAELWAQRPDLAVIATPTAMHAAQARECVQNGIAVYIEKPLDASLKFAEELLQQAQEKRALATVGYQWRHHPTLPVVQRWLEEKRVGPISSVLFESGESLHDYHPWEDYRESYAARREQGGGVLLTQSHDLDLLFHLFGPVKKVFALGGRRSRLEIDVEDTAVVSLQTFDDVPLVLRQDYLRRPRVKRLHVIGDNGQCVWDGFGAAVLMNAQGEISETAELPAGWTPESMARASLQRFLERVKNQKPEFTSLQEGLSVLKIADAALRSLQNGEAISLR